MASKNLMAITPLTLELICLVLLLATRFSTHSPTACQPLTSFSGMFCDLLIRPVTSDRTYTTIPTNVRRAPQLDFAVEQVYESITSRDDFGSPDLFSANCKHQIKSMLCHVAFPYCTTDRKSPYKPCAALAESINTYCPHLNVLTDSTFWDTVKIRMEEKGVFDSLRARRGGISSNGKGKGKERSVEEDNAKISSRVDTRARASAMRTSEAFILESLKFDKKLGWPTSRCSGGTKYAVLVCGAGDVEDEFMARGTVGMYHLFHNVAHFPRENIILMLPNANDNVLTLHSPSNNKVDVHPDYQGKDINAATLKRVMTGNAHGSTDKVLFTTPEDSVVLYIGSHGTSGDASTNQPSLLVMDGRSKEARKDSRLRYMGRDDLTNIVSVIVADRLLVYLDTCFSRNIATAPLPDEVFRIRAGNTKIQDFLLDSDENPLVLALRKKHGILMTSVGNRESGFGNVFNRAIAAHVSSSFVDHKLDTTRLIDHIRIIYIKGRSGCQFAQRRYAKSVNLWRQFKDITNLVDSKAFSAPKKGFSLYKLRRVKGLQDSLHSFVRDIYRSGVKHLRSELLAQDNSRAHAHAHIARCAPKIVLLDYLQSVLPLEEPGGSSGSSGDIDGSHNRGTSTATATAVLTPTTETVVATKATARATTATETAVVLPEGCKSEYSHEGILTAGLKVFGETHKFNPLLPPQLTPEEMSKITAEASYDGGDRLGYRKGEEVFTMADFYDFNRPLYLAEKKTLPPIGPNDLTSVCAYTS